MKPKKLFVVVTTITNKTDMKLHCVFSSRKNAEKFINEYPRPLEYDYMEIVEVYLDRNVDCNHI
jgi:hypothetical protein